MSSECITTAYEVSIKEELLHFHECIVYNRPPRTNAADAREDHVLLLAIVRAYRTLQHR